MLAAAIAASGGATFAQAPPSYPDLRAADPVRAQARLEVLARAEAALAAGDALTAADEFQRAAMMLHAADTEMGIARAAMQLGNYRQALGFMAHTAGAHGEVPSSTILYAWMLRAGAQDAVARRTLEQGLQRSPDDALLREAQRAFASPLPTASAALLALPGRVAPQATMAAGETAPPPSARVAGTAVLLADGVTVLLPSASLPTGIDTLWVRDGLGATRTAALAPVQPLQAQGVTMLRLRTPLTTGAAIETARDPFGGAPAFAASFATSEGNDAAWPWLQLGFVGSMDRNGRQGLNIELPPGPLGGPVLDANGRLAGIAVPGANGVPWLLPASAWRSLLPERAGTAAAATRTTPDQAYETTLRIALQLIVAR
jgi:hypothetical protein